MGSRRRLPTIVLQLDPVAVFKEKETREVMDPRDSEHRESIDDAIKAAFRSLKK